MAEDTEPYRHYHKDGSLWAVGRLLEGQAEGYWEWFRKDGTKLRSGHFRNGAQVGEWTTYDKAGKALQGHHDWAAFARAPVVTVDGLPG